MEERIPFDGLIDFIESRKSKGCDGGQYECLFVSQSHTRPSMRFSIYANEIETARWRFAVESKIAAALSDAGTGEKVFFELVD